MFRSRSGACGWVWGAAAGAAMVAAPAGAQEATNTPAATQPSVGRFYLRQKLQYVALGDDPTPAGREIDRLVATSSLSYGLARTLAVTAELPLEYEWEDGAQRSSERGGAGDASLMLKWRAWQRDLNPVDSLRFAVLGGLELPTGTGDLGSHSFDPFVGVVYTAILGRHGVNQAVRYTFTTGTDRSGTRPGDGEADALRYDTAYLFRLSPAAYSAETSAAWYLTGELRGLYETNGDNEVLLGPGVLYEARSFALEATVGWPVVSDVSERLETEVVVTLGFRVLF